MSFLKQEQTQTGCEGRHVQRRIFAVKVVGDEEAQRRAQRVGTLRADDLFDELLHGHPVQKATLLIPLQSRRRAGAGGRRLDKIEGGRPSMIITDRPTTGSAHWRWSRVIARMSVRSSCRNRVRHSDTSETWQRTTPAPSGTFYDKALEGASHHAVIPNVNTIDKLREVWPRLSPDEKKLVRRHRAGLSGPLMPDFRYGNEPSGDDRRAEDRGFPDCQGKLIVPTEAGLSLFCVLKGGRPGSGRSGGTAQLECLSTMSLSPSSTWSVRLTACAKEPSTEDG